MIDELKVRLDPAADRVRGVPQGHRTGRGRSCARSPERVPSTGSRCCSCSAPSPIRKASRSPTTVVDDEIEKTRRANPEDRRLIEYLESPRGRSYVRSTLRRSQVIERIIDRWIEAHPPFSDVRHTEDQPVEAVDQVEAATDALEPDGPRRGRRRPWRPSWPPRVSVAATSRGLDPRRRASHDRNPRPRPAGGAVRCAPHVRCARDRPGGARDARADGHRDLQPGRACL